MASSEQASETSGKADEQKTAPPSDLPPDDEEDLESDYEDLDDVLDDFNVPKQAAKSKVAGSSSNTTNVLRSSSNLQSPSDGDVFSEEEFMRQLEAEIKAELLDANLGGDKGKAPSQAGAKAGPSIPDKSGSLEKEMEEIMKQLDQDEVPASMESLFKDLLNLPKEATGGAAGAGGADREAAAAGIEEGNFQDTIQRTLERMRESGDKATAAATDLDSDVASKEMLEKLMKLIDGNEGDVDNIPDLEDMFNNMIKDVSNKEMLYEPMKDYHAKYGPWLEANKDKVPPEDYARYESQAAIVTKILEKFDEEGYSDKNPECLAYIWDHMQQMEAAGPPPEGIIPIPETPDADELANGKIPPECAPQ